MIRVYLACLTHVVEGRFATDGLPLNIGYLGGYLKAHSGLDVEVRLFVLPEELDRAMAEAPPHILGTSNYVWAARLNYLYLEHYKKLYPDMATVMGGPNLPGTDAGREAFLRAHPAIDFNFVMDAELSFVEVARRLHGTGFDIDKAKAGEPIRGVQWLRGGEFVDGGKGERVRDLDTIPSPYLSGMFDEFLELGLVPTLQTNRGCPFTCAYCHSGNRYFNKLHSFSMERVLGEVDYIASHTKSALLNFADDNYGIFTRDREISEKLSQTRKEHGWPVSVCVSTSKTNKERVSHCLEPIAEAMPMSISMQSMHGPTLKAIKRKNISFEKLNNMRSWLGKGGISSLIELIVPMPEETFESHMRGLEQSIDVKLDYLCSYTTMLLDNTPLLEDEEEYGHQGMVVRHRVVPRDFGRYLGRNVVEVEKVCVATKTFSLDEYVEARCVHFIVQAFYNLKGMGEFVALLRAGGHSVFEWLRALSLALAEDGGGAGEIYHAFRAEARDELWESREALLSYYEDEANFQKLFSGEKGANLIMKYGAAALERFEDFLALGTRVLLKTHPELDVGFVADLSRYCLCLRGDLFDLGGDSFTRTFDYDLLAWEKTLCKTGGGSVPAKKPTAIEFYREPKQLKLLGDSLDTYGDSQDARGKILARVGPSNLFWRSRPAQGA